MNKGKVLFTGGTGFIGRNILPILSEQFDVLAPRRSELNLYDEKEVKNYIINNKIDYIVHSANPNPSKNELDKADKMLRDSLQLFMVLYNCKDLVKKMVYYGSGAIYDKTRDIVSVYEENANDYIPKDDYGFAKYIMNHLTTGNVYNLCVFGCYGPSDADSKFITHCIRCCLDNKPVTIRQDCMFDYMHVYDLGRITNWLLSSNPKHNMYNACSGLRVSLSDIAKEVIKQMNSDSSVVIQNPGWNKEYTASNDRLLKEYNGKFISLDEGIFIQIDWEKENYRS